MINNKNRILKPLIENSNEAHIKPIIQSDGNTTLFQRDIDPPPVEQLDDLMDEIYLYIQNYQFIKCLKKLYLEN